MNYLEIKEVTATKLVCSHPKVLFCWATGHLSQNPEDSLMKYCIHLIMKDSSRKEFMGDDVETVNKQAEEFLQSL